MKCLNPNCSNELTEKQKKFCSNSCQAKVNSSIIWNREGYREKQKSIQTGMKHKAFPPSRAAKMSAIMKGRVSPLRGRKIGPMSEERKQHLSTINTGKKLPPFSAERKRHHREGAVRRLNRDGIHCLGDFVIIFDRG